MNQKQNIHDSMDLQILEMSYTIFINDEDHTLMERCEYGAEENMDGIG